MVQFPVHPRQSGICSVLFFSKLSNWWHLARGMFFRSPSTELEVARHSDAFVDNTQNGLNDLGLAEPWSMQRLIYNLQSMAQYWEKLLYCSGGAHTNCQNAPITYSAGVENKDCQS